jgi:YegS/Rv2252/BmrU family lipid kinase
MKDCYRKLQVIINPASGQAEPILTILNTIFKEHNVNWDVSITHETGDGARLAKEAIAAGADLIVSYGGDGTTQDVANGMVGQEVPMAILPGGTANAFASELGIPKVSAEAAEIIFNSEPRAVDLGKTDQGYFVLRVDMGITTKISEDASREMKDRFGILAYALSAVKAVGQAEKIKYRLNLDSEEVEIEGFACLVANVNDLGAFNLTLNSVVDLSDGLLDVFIIDDVGGTLLSVAAGIINLQDGAAASFKHWQVHEVRIEADPPQKVYGDGDPLGETPISISVAPKAIRVLTPRPPENISSAAT